MASSRKRNGDVLDGNRKRTNPGHFDGSYEINVIAANDLNTCVTVKDSDTILHMELKIQAKKKSINLIDFTFLNIFIKNLEGRITYYLEVNPSDTIGIVKAKMSDLAHVLVFNGVALEDSATLADLNINNGAILTRIDMAPRVKNETFVHTFTKKTISLSISPTNTIANVKLWIMYKEGVPVDEQVLIFNGMALGDSGTLSNFGVHDKSALTLVRRLRGLIRIFVKTFEGKTITLKVNPLNTIGEVKSQIEGEVDVPHDEQELIFDERVLDNLDTIANCNIKEESTLTLVRISTGNMRIFINTQGGRTITMIVKPSTIVDKLKSKFANIEDIQEHHVRLIFEGRLLKDGLTLADCHVHNESTIHSVIHLTGD